MICNIGTPNVLVALFRIAKICKQSRSSSLDHLNFMILFQSLFHNNCCRSKDKGSQWTGKLPQDTANSSVSI